MLINNYLSFLYQTDAFYQRPSGFKLVKRQIHPREFVSIESLFVVSRIFPWFIKTWRYNAQVKFRNQIRFPFLSLNSDSDLNTDFMGLTTDESVSIYRPGFFCLSKLYLQARSGSTFLKRRYKKRKWDPTLMQFISKRWIPWILRRYYRRARRFQRVYTSSGILRQEFQWGYSRHSKQIEFNSKRLYAIIASVRKRNYFVQIVNSKGEILRQLTASRISKPMKIRPMSKETIRELANSIYLLLSKNKWMPFYVRLKGISYFHRVFIRSLNKEKRRVLKEKENPNSFPMEVNKSFDSKEFDLTKEDKEIHPKNSPDLFQQVISFFQKI